MIILALLAAAAASPEPVYREIKDFVVACDNVRTCVARWATEDFPSEHSGFDAYLAISREGGPAGRVEVTLASPEEFRRPDARSLKLDGRPVGRDLGWRGEQDLVLGGDEAIAFVRKLRDGDLLTFSDGKGVRTVTLRGLTAALLAIDEAQGRLGTTGAFVRTGATPDATVPAPPPLPVVMARRPDPSLKVPDGFAARVRKAKTALLSQHDCDPDRTDAHEAFPLTRDEVLVMVGCVMGAYQGSSLVLRAPRDAPDRARLVVLPLGPGDPRTDPKYAGEYTNIEWDPETATLYEAAKGRGLGDCGSITVWAFDGKEFRVAEAHRLNRCSGGPPGEWPTIYRSLVETR